MRRLPVIGCGPFELVTRVASPTLTPQAPQPPLSRRRRCPDAGRDRMQQPQRSGTIGRSSQIQVRRKGGEAARYAARHGKGRVAKLVLIGAVSPIMVKSPANPGGTPVEVFNNFRKQFAANRAEFYRAVASSPFYSFNRPGVKA